MEEEIVKKVKIDKITSKILINICKYYKITDTKDILDIIKKYMKKMTTV